MLWSVTSAFSPFECPLAPILPRGCEGVCMAFWARFVSGLLVEATVISIRRRTVSKQCHRAVWYVCPASYYCLLSASLPSFVSPLVSRNRFFFGVQCVSLLCPYFFRLRVSNASFAAPAALWSSVLLPENVCCPFGKGLVLRLIQRRAEGKRKNVKSSIIKKTTLPSIPTVQCAFVRAHAQTHIRQLYVSSTMSASGWCAWLLLPSPSASFKPVNKTCMLVSGIVFVMLPYYRAGYGKDKTVVGHAMACRM